MGAGVHGTWRGPRPRPSTLCGSQPSSASQEPPSSSLSVWYIWPRSICLSWKEYYMCHVYVRTTIMGSFWGCIWMSLCIYLSIREPSSQRKQKRLIPARYTVNASGANQPRRATVQTFNLNHMMLIQEGVRGSRRGDLKKCDYQRVVKCKIIHVPVSLGSTSCDPD
jgi:hypothetical protein